MKQHPPRHRLISAPFFYGDKMTRTPYWMLFNRLRRELGPNQCFQVQKSIKIGTVWDWMKIIKLDKKRLCMRCLSEIEMVYNKTTGKKLEDLDLRTKEATNVLQFLCDFLTNPSYLESNHLEDKLAW